MTSSQNEQFECENERLVKYSYDRMLMAKEEDEAHLWWFRMQMYIALRSPETVKKLEKARGLS